MTQGTATPLLMTRRPEDFRRLRASVLSLAEKGRMTLEFLRELSFRLLEFSGAFAVEIAVVQKERIFHCDARSNDSPRFFCETRKRSQDETFGLTDGLRMLGSTAKIRRSLRDHLSKPIGTADLVAVWPLSSKGESPRDVICLLIPRGDLPCGMVLLAMPHSLKPNTELRAALDDLAQILGLALSHNQTQFELRERLKELTCMYGLANEAARGNQKIGRLMERIVTLLPPAWLYPDITEARIVLDGQTYATTGFNEGGARLASDIVVGKTVRGHVEVAYLQSRPELDEGPFLLEERKLLDSVAREVALILERRQAEKEQARLQDQLRHADRLATLGRLAAGVAHELNEPLTGILGFAELLQETEGLPDQAGQDLSRIRTAALHARDVVRKLLLFARQVPTKRVPVDLNRVLREALSLLDGRFRKQAIVTKTVWHPGDLLVTADESQLRQVAMNLMVNAAQAMPDGGSLSLTTDETEESVLLEVQDTGTGMTEEVKEKIFLPFFTTKDIHQGTGLGLSVVHGIVKAHGGTISVESAPGRGTRFQITLPKESVNHER